MSMAFIQFIICKIYITTFRAGTTIERFKCTFELGFNFQMAKHRKRPITNSKIIKPAKTKRYICTLS